MQSRTVPGLQLFSSMPKMPQNLQRVQSASARKEAKLRVWNLTLFHTPISHQIFQHVGENTIHHPTNNNHPIISWIQHFPFFMDGAQLGDLPARRHFTLRQQHSEQACHQRHQHIHLLELVTLRIPGMREANLLYINSCMRSNKCTTRGSGTN